MKKNYIPGAPSVWPGGGALAPAPEEAGQHSTLDHDHLEKGVVIICTVLYCTVLLTGV